MKVGYVPVVTAVDDSKSDLQLYQEGMALADMAEPLGFESLWSLEHHFTGYSMIPNPVQFLTYYAARTRNIKLGTAVIVLPWHDPVRIAEEIALLDVMSGGRTMFGFGRGAGSVEYDGLRVLDGGIARSLRRDGDYRAPGADAKALFLRRQILQDS